MSARSEIQASAPRRAKAQPFHAQLEGAYSVSPARYAKGMMAVRTVGRDGYKSRACYLAERLANGRHSNRARAYIMSPAAAARFVKLYAEGWDANAWTGELIPPRESGAAQ